MWTLLKMGVYAIVLAALAYTYFFVDVGGKTFAIHAQEIWQAPIVQQKVGQARNGIKASMAAHWVSLQQNAAIPKEEQPSASDRLTQEDRAMLKEVLSQAVE